MLLLSTHSPDNHKHDDEISASADETQGVDRAALQLYEDSCMNYDLPTVFNDYVL